MIKKILRNKGRFFLIVVSLLFLVLVRTFESQLFYDPFLAFFKSNYQNQTLPEYDTLKLFLGVLSRYFLNTFFSLVLIYLIFKERKMLLFSVWLYLILFGFLIVTFFSILILIESPNYLVLFYVRRFLIQPLFLVLFVPAFYYQKMMK
ncbi:exosortase F system-associated protein [Flavobacterium jejuense]|uniref:Exosortase F system-associated protein n=1 Tax=Flavobacterium jejuense TaxID=1544455 RepID=A0ABX0IRK6_9FLAO|nr:exosortase F system-associated protein [Flavobacterium jejuense]NHN26512.1 exosortase F system-associated protein [Flavobacterium jejuense]